MKFGFNSPSVNKVINDKAVNHPGAKTNRAGGLSYDIKKDSATRLLTMTGGQFFNEPTYYASDKSGIEGLSELALDVVNTAKAVAGTDSPRDLLSIAHYLRVEKNIRTTPALLYAIAAGEESNRERMVEYGPKVLRRADDVLQAFAAYFALYGTVEVKNGRVVRNVKLPNSFKKGLAAALAQFDEYQLLKWDNNSWPRFKDVVQMVYRRKDYPLSQDLLTYFMTGNITNPESTPIVAARKELSALKKWGVGTAELAKRAHAGWELLLSQFGNTKEVWEAMIDGGRTTLPVMAAVRNLRNIEQAGVSSDHWAKLKNSILSHEDNKMMPFRFLAARNNVSTSNARTIADMLLDKAALNVPELDGESIVIVDISGSMDTSISNKSDMTKAMVAKALAAVIAKAGGPDKVKIVAFGDNSALVEYSGADSVYRIIEEIDRTSKGLGWSTYAGKAILKHKHIKAKRIILLSDMQCYTRYSSYGSVDENVQQAFTKYKVHHKDDDIKLISVDIGGYGDSVVAPDKNVLLSTGFTESIVKEVVEFEAGLAAGKELEGDSVSLSMDYIRANF